MQSDLKCSSKPPLAAANVLLKKRHSLHNLEPLKRLEYLTRRGSHEIPRKEELSSSGKLRLLDSKSRSSSLSQLKTSRRNLSASNLAALSDSNLCIQVALPHRSYEHAGSQSNLAKQSFEVVVKRYYEQLTVGCGNTPCWNMFCASNDSNTKLNLRLASFVSIELATLGKDYFCKGNLQKVGKPLTKLSLTSNPNVTLLNNKQGFSLSNGQKSGSSTKKYVRSLLMNQRRPVSVNNDSRDGSLTSQQNPVSFLHKFFSSSPFKFLFSNEVNSRPNEKVKSSSLRDLRKTVVLSGSDQSLRINTSDNDRNLGEKQHDITIKSEVSNTTTLDLTDQGIACQKMKFPILVDLQTEIESLNIDDVNLEEFEDQCVLEMSSGNIKELSLTHLTLPTLEASLENYHHCGDPSFIVNTIRTVFSSPKALNASFKILLPSTEVQNSKNSNASLEKTSANEKCKLDIPSVRCAYKILFDLQPKETFIKPLQNSVEIHLKTLLSCKVHPSEVFQLFILLENPLLLKNDDLLHKFCAVVANLEKKTATCFVEILVEYDAISFLRILKVQYFRCKYYYCL